MSSFHISNFGGSCGHMPRDLDGFIHTTAAEWLRAPMDAADGPMTLEQAEELAWVSREEIEAAEAEIVAWQES